MKILVDTCVNDLNGNSSVGGIIFREDLFPNSTHENRCINEFDYHFILINLNRFIF